MTNEELLTVIQGRIDGKEIQRRIANCCGSWTTYTKSHWDTTCFEYRVKPEPKVLFVNEYKHVGYGYPTPERAIEYGTTTAIRTAVKYVEEV